jgi:hypothetical protein
MPRFRVVPALASGSPYDELGARIWADKPKLDLTRPSRITSVNSRQHRYYRVPPETIVSLACILDGSNVVQNDAANYFTSWCIEYASFAMPVKTYPMGAGWSALPAWLLKDEGHYLLACRMENVFGDPAYAGGVVLVHIDVTQT